MKRVLYIVFGVRNISNTTRYQHLKALTKDFDVVICSKEEIPPLGSEEFNNSYSFDSDSTFDNILFYPLWAILIALKTDADIVITTNSGLYVLCGKLHSLVYGSLWISDLYDGMELAFHKSGSWVLGIYQQLTISIAKQYLHQTDHAIFSINRGLYADYRIESSKSTQLTNGVTKETFENSCAYDYDDVDSDDDVLDITYVGKISLERGLDDIIRSVCEAEFTNPVRLNLIGQVNFDIEDVVDIEKHNTEIRCFGRLKHGEAIEKISTSDICLCLLSSKIPNFQYSYPIKLFEYAACGKPVIASDFEGLGDIIIHGENGILVDPDDQTAIISALERLASNEELRKGLGKELKSTASKYLWQDIRIQYIETIKSAYESKSER